MQAVDDCLEAKEEQVVVEDSVLVLEDPEMPTDIPDVGEWCRLSYVYFKMIRISFLI